MITLSTVIVSAGAALGWHLRIWTLILMRTILLVVVAEWEPPKLGRRRG